MFLDIGVVSLVVIAYSGLIFADFLYSTSAYEGNFQLYSSTKVSGNFDIVITQFSPNSIFNIFNILMKIV